MATYVVCNVYYSEYGEKNDKAKLIYQTWSMAGCESHVEWFVSRGRPGRYFYGPAGEKMGKRVQVKALLSLMPTWELVVVPHTPVAVHNADA